MSTKRDDEDIAGSDIFLSMWWERSSSLLGKMGVACLGVTCAWSCSAVNVLSNIQITRLLGYQGQEWHPNHLDESQCSISEHKAPSSLTGHEERVPQEIARLISLLKSLAPGTARAKEVHFPDSRCKVTSSMWAWDSIDLNKDRNFSFLAGRRVKAWRCESHVKPLYGTCKDSLRIDLLRPIKYPSDIRA